MIKKKYVHLIVGGGGQDAYYLTRLLIKKKERTILVTRRNINNDLIKNKYVQSFKLNIFNKISVFKFLKKFKYIKIYFFASYSSSYDKVEHSKDLIKNLNLNIIGLTNFFEYARENKSLIKIFYACSSHIFNETYTKIQSEKTKPRFNSNYALAKYLGKEICSFYRKKKIFCSVGIMYSHPSRLSKKKFLVGNIINQFEKGSKLISIINEESQVDLLSVNDAVKAIYKIMNLRYSSEFIISSNKLIKVKEIIYKIATLKKIKNFKIKNLKKISTNSNATVLRGDNSKLKKNTNWKINDNLEKIILGYLN